MLDLQYKVGDLAIYNRFIARTRIPSGFVHHYFLKRSLRLYNRPLPSMSKSIGIITESFNYKKAWNLKKIRVHTTTRIPNCSDNVYIWLSQQDGQEYLVYQNEIKTI